MCQWVTDICRGLTDCKKLTEMFILVDHDPTNPKDYPGLFFVRAENINLSSRISKTFFTEKVKRQRTRESRFTVASSNVEKTLPISAKAVRPQRTQPLRRRLQLPSVQDETCIGPTSR